MRSERFIEDLKQDATDVFSSFFAGAIKKVKNRLMAATMMDDQQDEQDEAPIKAGSHQELELAYKVLGVQIADSDEMVKSVFRAKAKCLHPDSGGDAERFKALRKAYNIIMRSRNVKQEEGE